MRLLAQLVPACFLHVDAKLFRCGLDPMEGLFALGVGDVLDLIEAGDRITYVGCVVERLLALFGEGIGGVAHLVAVFGGECVLGIV